MTIQLALFEEEPAPSECRYPMVSGSTGYRYGCRCPRCCQAKHGTRWQPEQCKSDGCTAPRMKFRRWCAAHLPPPKANAIIQQAACGLCGRTHSWYESVLDRTVRADLRDLYRWTCNGCRKGYINAIKQHRLDTVNALRLITAESCELCGKPFPIREDGRRHSVIDHDHHCCSGKTSCGRCVRGVICTRCNHVLASIESAQDVGLDRVMAYLQRDRGAAF